MKVNSLQGKPELTKAGTNAVGPGNVSITIPALIHSRTNKKPGSEIAGVPASLTKIVVVFWLMVEIKSSTTLCSLC
jgi:hypothetical protein